MVTWKQAGQRIREVREQVGLTQEAVAKHLGVTRPVVTNIEQGKRPLNLEELEKLADLLGYPPSYFLRAGDVQDAVEVIFRSQGLEEDDLMKLSWLNGFLRDFWDVQQWRSSRVQGNPNTPDCS